MRLVNAILTFILLSSFCFSATIYVPDHYPAIQDAIRASKTGDTIVVRPGTYVENLTIQIPGIKLTSEKGPSQTVIDGNNKGTTVSFLSIDSDSILRGFTITGGYSLYQGGGIYCHNGASPTITNNIIALNSAGTDGGGLFLWVDCSPTISNNIITENKSKEGAGIYGYLDCNPLISGNTISGNRASNTGSTMWFYHSSPKIIYNTIRDNTSVDAGSCIDLYDIGSPYLSMNLIVENNLSSAIYCHKNCSALIKNNILIGNGNSYSCGIGSSISSPIIFGNIISRNLGCGIECTGDGSPIVSNNSIIENRPNVLGGGIICNDGASPILTNTILWGNASPGWPEVYVMNNTIPCSLNVSNSNIGGGQSSVWVDPGSTLVWGTGNIDADPLFADPAHDDYHLTWPSPCRNTGDNAAVTELYDFEGDPRTVGTVDMGADEFYYHLYSVGDVLPGSPIDIKAVGIPGLTTLLALGTGIQDPPFPTPYGDLWLQFPLAKSWQLGAIPTTGILTHTATVPSGWPSGSQHPFQALVGPWGGGATRLTNLELLVVQ